MASCPHVQLVYKTWDGSILYLTPVEQNQGVLEVAHVVERLRFDHHCLSEILPMPKIVFHLIFCFDNELNDPTLSAYLTSKWSWIFILALAFSLSLRNSGSLSRRASAAPAAVVHRPIMTRHCARTDMACWSEKPGLGSILDTVSKDTEDTALSSILSVSQIHFQATFINGICI